MTSLNNSLAPEPLCHCPRSPERFKFLNIATGEVTRLNCKSYACPYCSKRKIYKLRNALTTYFAQFSHVRMWTFTMSNRFFLIPELSALDRQKLHATVFQDAWKRFTRDLRRCEMLTDQQKKVEYVRVTERHANGFVHFHVMVTEFLPVTIIRYMWRVSVSRALASANIQHAGYVGNVNVVGSMQNAGQSARYVTKYLAKSISQCQNLTLRKRWVKSRGASIFPPREANKDYVLIRFTAKGDMFAPFNQEVNKDLLLAQKTLPEGQNSDAFDLLNLSPYRLNAQNAVPIASLTLFEFEAITDREEPPPKRSLIDMPDEPFDWIWEAFGE